MNKITKNNIKKEIRKLKKMIEAGYDDIENTLLNRINRLKNILKY